MSHQHSFETSIFDPNACGMVPCIKVWNQHDPHRTTYLVPIEAVQTWEKFEVTLKELHGGLGFLSLRDGNGGSVISEQFWRFFLKAGASFSFAFHTIVHVWIQCGPSPSRRVLVRCDSEITVFDLRHKAYRALAEICSLDLLGSPRAIINLYASGVSVLDSLRVKNHLQPGSTELFLTVVDDNIQYRPGFVSRNHHEYPMHCTIRGNGRTRDLQKSGAAIQSGNGSCLNTANLFKHELNSQLCGIPHFNVLPSSPVKVAPGANTNVTNVNNITTRRSSMREDSVCSSSSFRGDVYTPNTSRAAVPTQQARCPHASAANLCPECHMSGIEDYYHTETDEAPKLDMKPAMPVDIHKDVRRRPKALDVFMFGNIVYCGSWVRTGACNGCVSTHMMPSISDMKKIGYSRYPSWYRQKIDIQHDLRDGKLKAAPELPYNSNLESFCAQWIQTGKCEFQERGTECLLEHIMPNPQVLEFMGHTEYPKWFIETDWSEEVNKSGSDSLHESADQRGNACSLSFCSSYAGPSTSSPTRILQNPTENSTSRAPQAQHVLYHDSGYPSIAREVEYPPAFWSHRLDHLSESAKFRNVVGLPQGADAAEQSESETHLHGAKKDENTLELVDKILPQSVESSSSRSDHESITVPNTTNTPNGGGMLVPMNGDVDEPLARHRRYVPPTVQDEQQSPSESSIKALAEKTRRREANYASQLSGYSSF